jgi:hypothetical protein
MEAGSFLTSLTDQDAVHLKKYINMDAAALF